MIHNHPIYNTLQSTKQLHSIYPDIQQQLCSRHSTLFGKLKQTFNKLYDNMEPMNYVIVKGNCQFVEQAFTEVGLSMALQNGIISLVTKTYSMSQIFINSNHFSQELIFSHTGQIQEGLHTWTQQIQQIIKLATSNLLQQQLSGGILYIHANIPQGQFNYKQSFLISLYLSIMAINQNLQNVTIDKMIQDISSLGFVGRKDQVERVFKGYKNRQFNLTIPDMLLMKGGLVEIDVEEEGNAEMLMMEQENNEMLKKQHNKEKNSSLKCIGQEDKYHHKNKSNKNIHLHSKIHHHSHTHTHQTTHLQLTMPNEYKLFFCKLDLAKDDVEYELHRRDELMKRKQQLLKQLNEKYKIKGLFELFHKLDAEVKLDEMIFNSVHQRVYQPKSMEELQCMEEDEILNQPNRLLQNLLQQTQLVSQFTNQKLNLQQLISQIWKINSKQLKIHSEEVVQLVQDMKEILGIEGCMIVNRNFLLIVVHKNQFTELLCEVKHKMNKGELKSKSLFRIEDEDLVQHRWSSDKVIGQKIFSSVPAEGVGIFDPSEAIWFD